ncbi:unknown [Ruminococcus sp. CAG:90]|nr:unknown [Ruminococcus sp. CAG:90]
MFIFCFGFLFQFLFLLSKKINTCSNDTCSNDDLRKAVADIVYIVGHIIRYNEVQKTCETTPQDADTKQDQNPCNCTLMLL